MPLYLFFFIMNFLKLLAIPFFLLISFTGQILIADEMLYCNFLRLFGLLYNIKVLLSTFYVEVQALNFDFLDVLGDDIFWWR